MNGLSGGGSSLELIDPHSNHRLAANWADSDETKKSAWVDIENTGVLDNGSNYYAPGIYYAQIGLLDAGECLVDNVEVDYKGSNYAANATFESGLGLTLLDPPRLHGMFQPGKQRLSKQSFPSHPVQRPSLDRRQFLPG